MADSIDTTPSDAQTPEFDDGRPEGGHALEVAARAGFGPLSPLAQEVWHGRAVPCVSCGQLVHRDDPACEYCGQDLSDEMIQKMRQHSGPWFVLEHVRPFPGVSLERVIRQIRRGLITETSIIRGPSNDYQWRFAVETPGLCRYFGKCWCCHGSVTLSDAYCPHCLHFLSFEKPRATMQVPGSIGEPTAVVAPAPAAVSPAAHAPASGAQTRSTPTPIDNRKSTIENPRSPESPDLARLSAAVRQARATHMDSQGETTPRVAGVSVTWIAAFLIIAALVALLLVSRARSQRPAAMTAPSLPTMSAPGSPPASGGHVPAQPTSTSSPPPNSSPVQSVTTPPAGSPTHP